MKIIQLTHNNPWLVMSGVWIQAVTISIMGSSLGIMLPSITEDLDISPVQAGILGSAFFLGSQSILNDVFSAIVVTACPLKQADQ